jgi:hypothetical protein
MAMGAQSGRRFLTAFGAPDFSGKIAGRRHNHTVELIVVPFVNQYGIRFSFAVQEAYASEGRFIYIEIFKAKRA